MNRINMAKTCTGLLFLICGVILLHSSYAARGVTFAAPDELGPMVYPRALLYFWVALSAIYLVLPQKPFAAAELQKSLPGLCLVAGVIAAYIFLFGVMGLFGSTVAFLLGFFWVMGYREWRRGIPIAMLLGVITWLVFEKVLGVIMPPNLLMELLTGA